MVTRSNKVRRRELGARIRELRKERNLTQFQLGEMAGSDHNYIYEIENGKKSPTIDTLCRIADALDVRVNDLITF